MKIALNYKIPPRPEPQSTKCAKCGHEQKQSAPETASNQLISLNLIMFALGKKYDNELKRLERRTWARINSKFDDAIDAQAEEIALDKTELDFILDAFKDTKFPVNESKYVVMLEDELEAALKELGA